MKNITITIDEEAHRKARIYAAMHGTSLSALVKEYLNNLGDDGPVEQGVREMPMPYKPAEALMPLIPQIGPEGQPYFVNGKWVYTKDGKPRKPGAMRHLGGGWNDDFDEWPDGFIDALYGDDTPASNTWWLGMNDELKKPKNKKAKKTK